MKIQLHDHDTKIYSHILQNTFKQKSFRSIEIINLNMIIQNYIEIYLVSDKRFCTQTCHAYRAMQNMENCTCRMHFSISSQSNNALYYRVRFSFR